VLEKLRANAGLIGETDNVDALAAAIMSIDRIPIQELTPLLRAFRSGGTGHD